jgi:PAS domain S-box-containing protein
VIESDSDDRPRERAEDALARSEGLFRSIFEQAAVGMAQVGLDGSLLRVNQKLCDIVGYRREELLGRSFHELAPPDDRAAELDGVRALIAGTAATYSAETRRVRKDGSPVWVHLTASLARSAQTQPDHLVCTVEDISPRRCAEAALRRSEETLRVAQELAGMGSWEVELATGTTRWSAQMFPLFERDPALGALPFPEFLATIHPDDLPTMLAFHERVQRGPGAQRGQFRIRCPSGAIKHFAATAATLPQSSPEEGARIAGVIYDITEFKRVEEALRQHEERLRLALEAGRVGMWIWDMRDNTTIWNAREYELFGLPPGEGHVDPDLLNARVHPEDRQAVSEHVAAAQQAGGDFNHEFRVVYPDQTVHWLAGVGRVVRDASGRQVQMMGVTFDITERKVMEERLRQSQKMEAVGRLAGGIAHDFNNLLTVIIGSSEAALARRGPNPVVTGELEAIRDAGRRAGALTQQLLAFGRKQMLEPRVLDLNAVVAGLEPMLRRIIGEDVRLSVALDPRIERVQVDPSQIEQVILNLAVNARDAMPDGGRLVIATGTRTLDGDASALASEARPGRHVVLSIEDTGRGMSAEVKARIFEPFFTTKGPGQGTGLGLATSYGIVKQSGGHILVHSEPGTGTRFEVCLPAAFRAGPSTEPPAFAERSQRGAEAILLVEDEEMVRKLLRTLLADQGYTVLDASTPSAALRIARDHHAPIDLLLTDVVMPEQSGRRLAEALRMERPDLKVLYISGYADDAVLRAGVVEETEDFLQKPFLSEALLKKVRDVLDDGSAK